MLVEKAIKLYSEYLRSNTRPHTIRVFLFSLDRFDVAGGLNICTGKTTTRGETK